MSRRRSRSILGFPALTALAVVVAMAAACGSTANPGSGPTTAAPTPTPTPTPTPAVLSAPVGATVTGQPIDGITCDAGPQLVIHVHSHLAIFVGGAARAVPKNIGILAPVGGASCTYWLHSHDDDGIMHVESPVMRSFTLGDYFDVWGIPLDGSHVGPAAGTVTVYLNGQRFTGDVRSIALAAHALVQLDVGVDVPPAAYTFPSGD